MSLRWTSQQCILYNCALCINKLVKHKLTHGAVGGGLETCDTPMICSSKLSFYWDLAGDGPTEFDSNWQ